MTYPSDRLLPFIRDGQARPMTSADYAYVAQVTRASAQAFLWKMARWGYLACVEDQKTHSNIYEITDQGIECLEGTEIAAPPVPRKLADARLAAVAKRAFGGPIDVRPLLPEYEERIGEMMRRDVPRQFRPPVHLRLMKATGEASA